MRSLRRLAMRQRDVSDLAAGVTLAAVILVAVVWMTVL